jgi:hypothetical protein
LFYTQRLPSLYNVLKKNSIFKISDVHFVKRSKQKHIYINIQMIKKILLTAIVIFLFLGPVQVRGKNNTFQSLGSKTGGDGNGKKKKPKENVQDVVCFLTIPDFPLSAAGLATPYLLEGCKMADTPSFVQATIFDLDTGNLFVYSPLVIDINANLAEPPVFPVLPDNFVMGIWFGSNADILVLNNTRGIINGNCVNGLLGSPFGQFAYCNAVEFFDAITNNIWQPIIPLIGTAIDGLPCPTVNDYFVVDADPNDNLQTTYLLLKTGQTVQDTARNRRLFNNFMILQNPSDEALLTNSIHPAMVCKSFLAPDLADDGNLVASLALNELQAQQQVIPIAKIPANNPMTLVNDKPNLDKLNLYRVGVNQPVVNSLEEASTTRFCINLVAVGAKRIDNNKIRLRLANTPAADVANSLFTFLAFRLKNSFDILGCQALINAPNPVELIMEGDIVVNAIFNFN